MKTRKDRSDQGLFKGVATAYVILILHVILIAAVGLLVVFFSGILNYMLFILIGFAVLIIASGYYFFRRLKRRGREINEALHSPMFNGRSVEVSFLGGMASLRLGDNTQPPVLDSHRPAAPPLLEDPAAMHIRKISELAELYENNLISTEEFETLKRRIINA